MNRKKITAIAGGLFAAMLSLTTPAAAAEAVTAYNYKIQYLVAEPDDSMETSCVQRRIELAAGNYDWAQFFNGGADVMRPNMYLGAGWYTWTDCLDPNGSDAYDYFHTTTLDPDNPSWETATISGPWWLADSKNVGWGSRLAPLFLSSTAEEKAPDGLTDLSPQVESRAG
ncbi:hypothetical protein [Nonomuraea indica]|uniref:hypothetical protein n=1 Tax=Nonomuraea indica TaxID=1581193 RepID=UPI000C7CF72E|nr:hypothetical protein [Nonomuraea indica]